MNHSITILAFFAFLGSTAWAQPAIIEQVREVDLRSEEGTLVWGNASLSFESSQGGGRMSDYVPEAARAELRGSLELALEATRADPSPLRVHLRGGRIIYLDTEDPYVEPLRRRLVGLGRELVAPMKNPQLVRITTRDDDDRWGPRRTLYLLRGAEHQLRYQVGAESWRLPAPTLTFAERLKVRLALQKLGYGGRAVEGAVSDPRTLVTIHDERTHVFTGADLASPGVASLVKALREILERVFCYDERTLIGVVRDGRLRCDGVEVMDQDPLTARLGPLEGQQVAFRALVRRDGTWAMALDLLASKSQAGRYTAPTAGALGHLPR